MWKKKKRIGKKKKILKFTLLESKNGDSRLDQNTVDKTCFHPDGIFSRGWCIKTLSLHSPDGFLILTIFQHETAVHGFADGLTRSLKSVPARKWLPSTRLMFPSRWRSAMFRMWFQVLEMSQALDKWTFWSDCSNTSRTSMLLTARTNYINMADYKFFFYILSFDLSLMLQFTNFLHPFKRIEQILSWTGLWRFF